MLSSNKNIKMRCTTKTRAISLIAIYYTFIFFSIINLFFIYWKNKCLIIIFILGFWIKTNMNFILLVVSKNNYILIPITYIMKYFWWIIIFITFINFKFLFLFSGFSLFLIKSISSVIIFLWNKFDISFLFPKFFIFSINSLITSSFFDINLMFFFLFLHFSNYFICFKNIFSIIFYIFQSLILEFTISLSLSYSLSNIFHFSKNRFIRLGNFSAFFIKSSLKDYSLNILSIFLIIIFSIIYFHFWF